MLPSSKLTIDPVQQDVARSVFGALQDLIEPAPGALTLFEDGPGGWRVEAYYATPAKRCGACSKTRVHLRSALSADRCCFGTRSQLGGNVASRPTTGNRRPLRHTR